MEGRPHTHTFVQKIDYEEVKLMLMYKETPSLQMSKNFFPFGGKKFLTSLWGNIWVVSKKKTPKLIPLPG